MSYCIPVDGRIFSMYMDDLFAPFSQLCHRVDQLYHLVGRLPFQTEVVILYFLKHHFPGFRVETDVAGGMFPGSIHQAVFNTQFHTFFFCKVCQFTEHFSELFVCGFYRFSFPGSCKGAYVGSSEFFSRADHLFQCLSVLCVLDRVTIISECSDLGICSCKEFVCGQCQFVKICSFQ